MTSHPTPELSEELAKRIRLVRRDVGGLLFHFTRNIEPQQVTISLSNNQSWYLNGSASAVLRKILHEEELIGTSRWTYEKDTICFTEAPIQEFNSVFSLVSIASTKAERPRYEPYGIAVSKKWLFEQGGRPVIYDHPTNFSEYSESLRYRFVPHDPTNGIDFTWEREWRIQAAKLRLDPKHTLVVVPTSEEAFEVVYEFAKIEADWDVEGSDGEAFISGAYHAPKWLAVSLDMLGFKDTFDNA